MSSFIDCSLSWCIFVDFSVLVFSDPFLSAIDDSSSDELSSLDEPV
eukprot:01954.XXX_17094_17231_1 [CDS] Oithona nana genome sequencing.